MSSQAKSAAFAARRAKTRALEQAMMQEPLTEMRVLIWQ